MCIINIISPWQPSTTVVVIVVYTCWIVVLVCAPKYSGSEVRIKINAHMSARLTYIYICMYIQQHTYTHINKCHYGEFNKTRCANTAPSTKRSRAALPNVCYSLWLNACMCVCECVAYYYLHYTFISFMTVTIFLPDSGLVYTVNAGILKIFVS